MPTTKTTIMKLSLRRNLYYSFLLFITISCAQNTYTGTIENWNNKQAEIILPTENPMVIGSISQKGNAIFSLNEDVTNAILGTLQSEEENGNVRIQKSTVSKAFYCNSEHVEVKNGDINIHKLASRGTFYAGNLANEEFFGQFRITSSQSFNDSYFALGKKDFVKGFYINFFYVEEAASVNGECKTESYTMDMKRIVEIVTMYNINLKKGWNMVKIEVKETYNDGGKIRPLKTAMSTIEKLPKDARLILFEQ